MRIPVPPHQRVWSPCPSLLPHLQVPKMLQGSPTQGRGHVGMVHAECRAPGMTKKRFMQKKKSSNIGRTGAGMTQTGGGPTGANYASGKRFFLQIVSFILLFLSITIPGIPTLSTAIVGAPESAGCEKGGKEREKKFGTLLLRWRQNNNSKEL